VLFASLVAVEDLAAVAAFSVGPPIVVVVVAAE